MCKSHEHSRINANSTKYKNIKSIFDKYIVLDCTGIFQFLL